jgi:hypothetical protein
MDAEFVTRMADDERRLVFDHDEITWPTIF